MKKRRFAIVAFLLCACLAIGAGYAALTDALSMTGYAEVKTTQSSSVFDEKIYFKSATAPTTAAGTTTGTSGVADTASVSGTDPDVATFSINSLALKDEYATFTFVIENTSEFDANITISKQPTANTGYFDTKIEFPNGQTVSAGGTLTVTVTTKLIKNVTENISASTTIEFTATTVDPTP